MKGKGRVRYLSDPWCLVDENELNYVLQVVMVKIRMWQAVKGDTTTTCGYRCDGKIRTRQAGCSKTGPRLASRAQAHCAK